MILENVASVAEHVPGVVQIEADVESSERARQREIAAYVSAASFPPGLPSGPGAEPFLNADPTLNALVQLGAVRLNCDRAFLSFIDRHHQFIVSEITRSHSIGTMRCAPNESIFLGVCKLDLCWGVCPTTMKAFMDETGEWVRTGPNIIANRTRYVINDFRADPEYMERPYVKGYPYMRSYLEVPLISPLGYLLGSYCVVDNKLNVFDNDETVGIMDEISSAIMAHLENVRIRQSRDRAEQLIDGLSGFIRQQAPTQKLRQAGNIRKTIRSGSDVLLGAINGLGGAATRNGQGRKVDSTATEPTEEPGQSQNQLSSSSNSSDLSAVFGNRRDSTTSPITSSADEEGDCATAQAMAAFSSDALRDPAPTTKPEDRASGFIGSANIKSTFFRAAVTIRQSVNMDGFMFLDAAPTAGADRPEEPALDANGDPSPYETDGGPFCAAIVQTDVGLGNELTSPPQIRLPQAVLQRFIRRFPQGHVFSADELGPIAESYGPGKPFPGWRSADEENSLHFQTDVATLFRVLAGAKYVLFLPLWHFQRECWYAAAIGWVADSTRMIDLSDVGLVAAFCNSIMAEVSRLEALDASRAKSDFVSSLSHELRSPLHGVMATSELLREGLSNPSLLSTLDLLDSCAGTLLDTFNNLLDHAMVTNAGEGPWTPIAGSKFADLGALVENVVEAVRIGHLSGNAFKASTHWDAVGSATLLDASGDPPDHPLLITVNIAQRPTWQLPINVGAWKRIVMNILGNALKYASRGRIEVSLKVVQRRREPETAPSDYISFSVQDAGSGMSSDFLKYHLFTPFRQENSHSPGMGLGLSIVKQLATSLGGSVDVRSSVGIGTLVEVLVPLDQSASGLPLLVEDSYDEHRRQLARRTVCLVTPQAYSAMTRTDAGAGAGASDEAAPTTQKRVAVVERALRGIAGDALGMKVILGTADQPVPDADLYILDGAIVDERMVGGLESLLPTQYFQARPLVLLCSGSGQPSCLKHVVMNNHPHHLHHPIGPRKLALVLSSALRADSSVVQGTALIDTDRADGSMSRLSGTAVADSAKSLLPTKSPIELETSQARSQDHREPAETSAPEREAVNGTNAPQQKRHNLLLVEDNAINMRILGTVVGKLRHTYATACHGLEAVQLYNDSLVRGPRFDLIFMDISMPVMNGIQATREIRQLERDAGVPPCKIVALTGLSGDVSRNEALAGGCNRFLVKPVKMAALRTLLDEELNNEAQATR